MPSVGFLEMAGPLVDDMMLGLRLGVMVRTFEVELSLVGVAFVPVGGLEVVEGLIRAEGGGGPAWMGVPEYPSLEARESTPCGATVGLDFLLQDSQQSLL